ncbi:MAG: hypothetical protein PHE83_04865 [Opitutaceae bacterium]|nr:hypothetical protein [Opitutaceae bacterium]
MKAVPRQVFLIGIGLLLLASAFAREKWIYARTEHFEMLSCASEWESSKILSKLEQFRATVLAIYPLPRFHDPKATIVLFATDRQFEPYKPLYHGKPAEAAGYCIGGSDETVIAMSADYDSEQTDEIIFHEYVHLLLAVGGEHPPPWLNEGLAELFSTFAIERGSFKLGLEKPAHTEFLRRRQLMPLGRLFAVTQNSPEYHEGHRRDIFYAESWALLHFLVCGQDRATTLPELQRFTELIATPGRAIDQSFQESFGMGYEEMERELKRYLEDGRYYYRRDKLIMGDLSARIKFRPASELEREVELINLRSRLQEPGNAAYLLLQLAKSHPEAPRPHEVMAAVAMREGDPEGALMHWRRAAELGSDNAYVYVRLAAERLDQITSGLTLDYRLPGEAATILRGWLDRAVALSPRYLEAYEGLALVEALAKQPRAEIVKRVLEVMPRMRDKSRALLALAIVSWRAGNFATASQIARSLIDDPRLSPHLHFLARRLAEPPQPKEQEPPEELPPLLSPDDAGLSP